MRDFNEPLGASSNSAGGATWSSPKPTLAETSGEVAAADSDFQNSVRSTDGQRLKAIEEAIDQLKEVTAARIDRLTTSVASCFQIMMANSLSGKERDTRGVTIQRKDVSAAKLARNDFGSELSPGPRSLSASQASQKGRKRKRQHYDDDLMIDPDNSGTDEEWVVEKILDDKEVRCPGRGRRRKRRYLCQWKSTWVDEEFCKDLMALDEYERAIGKPLQ